MGVALYPYRYQTIDTDGEISAWVCNQPGSAIQVRSREARLDTAAPLGGYAFVEFRSPMVPDADALVLGDTIDGAVSANLRTVDSLLGFRAGTLGATTCNALLAELLTHAADPLGQGASPVLMDTRIRLSGRTVWTDRSIPSDAVWKGKILARLQDSFQRTFNRTLAVGKVAVARKLLAMLDREWRWTGITADLIAPYITPLEPATQQSDDFNGEVSQINLEDRTNWTLEFGTAGDWTVETSGIAKAQAGVGVYFSYDVDLSSGDCKVQLLQSSTARTDGNHKAGPLARYSASRNGYVYITGPPDNAVLSEFSGGTESVLGTRSGQPADGVVCEVRCVGSQIDAFEDDSSVGIGATDTTHDNTNLIMGLFGIESGTGTNERDDWLSVEVSSGVTLPQIERHYPRGVMRGVLRGAV